MKTLDLFIICASIAASLLVFAGAAGTILGWQGPAPSSDLIIVGLVLMTFAAFGMIART